ncbi:hypothetical protein Vau01_005400 [Virgisporangium aurantiacum]|uniref:Uncharacterized protein n=1 Tax=Virgisporangium aurantiacum TaxID=175570 RepID=A0A8J3YWN3_9ACTN|nr:hypothetical protein Vau01_005400 [Virgisporangium aurantiacum]
MPSNPPSPAVYAKPEKMLISPKNAAKPTSASVTIVMIRAIGTGGRTCVAISTATASATVIGVARKSPASELARDVNDPLKSSNSSSRRAKVTSRRTPVPPSSTNAIT